jgi:predicted transcriptional regulator
MPPEIPPQVQALAPRERQVALLIYKSGGLTANAVLSQLDDEIRNASVRSMLVRLVRKGIVKRLWGGRGQRREYVYVPALCSEDVKEKALRTLAEQMFQGSLPDLARALFAILDRDMPLVSNASDGDSKLMKRIPIQLISDRCIVPKAGISNAATQASFPRI